MVAYNLRRTAGGQEMGESVVHHLDFDVGYIVGVASS